MIELEALNWSFQLLLYIYNMISGMSRADVKTSFSSYFFCKWSRPHISQHSFRRHEWTWMQRFRATSRDPSPNRPMSSLGQHFSQINLKKKQKNKPYKAFSRYRTDLSLVGLNSLPYMFFLRPPAERCFPSLSWIPLLSFQHLPLLLQLSHGLLAVFQQIKLLKNNSSRKKSL